MKDQRFQGTKNSVILYAFGLALDRNKIIALVAVLIALLLLAWQAIPVLKLQIQTILGCY
jgi:hypothetical protein